AAVSVALMLVGSLLSPLAPWPLSFLIDTVLRDNGLVEHPLPGFLARLLGPLAGNRFDLLVLAVLAGLTINLLQHALNVVDNYVNTKLELSMVLDFRSDMFHHVQKLSLAHHDKKRSGMLIYIVNSQGDSAARLLMAIPALAQSTLML